MPKRVDANQPAIVAALRALGCYVFDCHELGRGFPDLFVSHDDRMWLVETKSAIGRLTHSEREFMFHCPAEVYRIIRTPEEAAALVEDGK